MDGFRVFVQNGFKKVLHSVLREGRLQAGSVIERHPQGPHVTSLVVVLILDDLGRERLRCTDQLVGLNIALVREHTRLTHVTKFQSLSAVFQKQVHALDVSVDDVMRVQVQHPKAQLPGEGPKVFLGEVPPLVLLLLYHLHSQMRVDYT